MTKKSYMLKQYHKFSVSDSFILGFVYDNKIYMLEVAKIAPRFVCIEKASRNQGDSLRIRLRKENKLSLMKKNPVCLGNSILLENATYNKGEMFEKLVAKHFHKAWKKDTTPFWIDGDITIDNKRIQIKFENATMTNTKQLTRLKRGAI